MVAMDDMWVNVELYRLSHELRERERERERERALRNAIAAAADTVEQRRITKWWGGYGVVEFREQKTFFANTSGVAKKCQKTFLFVCEPLLFLFFQVWVQQPKREPPTETGKCTRTPQAAAGWYIVLAGAQPGRHSSVHGAAETMS
jgi:hypothetical protein